MTQECKLQNAYREMVNAPIYTFVKFPDGTYRAQSVYLGLTLEKLDNLWVGCTTEHEPSDIEISAKSLTMAKKRLVEWAKNYDTEYASECDTFDDWLDARGYDPDGIGDYIDELYEQYQNSLES